MAYKNQNYTPQPPRPQVITQEHKDNALAVIGGRQIGNLAPDQNSIIAYSVRLASMLTYKGSEKLTDDERFALAAAAITYDLNPALYEIWYVPKIGLMVGRNGWTKKLNELAEKMDFRWWPEYEELRPDEYAKFQIPKDVVTAWKCSIRRSDTLREYLNILNGMQNSGVKFDSDFIIECVGRPPVTVGVGYITKEEYEGKPDYNDPTRTIGGLKNSTMNLSERAQKRAFRMCCSQMINIPLGKVPETMVVEGKFVSTDSWEDEQEFGGAIEATYREPVEVSPNLYPDDSFEGFANPESYGHAVGSPIDVKVGITNAIEGYHKTRGADSQKAYPSGQRGKLTGQMDNLCEGANNRHIVLEYLFDEPSIKGINNAQGWALTKWLETPNAKFEISSILEALS